MRVYTTGDSPDVYEDSFMATAKSGDGVFKPTVILISTRLGIDKNYTSILGSFDIGAANATIPRYRRV